MPIGIKFLSMLNSGSTQPSDYLLEGKEEGTPRRQAYFKRLSYGVLTPTPLLTLLPTAPRRHLDSPYFPIDQRGINLSLLRGGKATDC